MTSLITHNLRKVMVIISLGLASCSGGGSGTSTPVEEGQPSISQGIFDVPPNTQVIQAITNSDVSDKVAWEEIEVDDTGRAVARTKLEIAFRSSATDEHPYLTARTGPGGHYRWIRPMSTQAKGTR
jgi:hypothetical protein